MAWDLWFGTDLVTGQQRRAPAIGEPMTPHRAPELVLGTMTEVDEPRVLAFDVAPGGGPGDRVRLELTEGTGHGARLVLVVTGTDPAERAVAVDEWGSVVAHLAEAGAQHALSGAASA